MFSGAASKPEKPAAKRKRAAPKKEKAEPRQTKLDQLGLVSVICIDDNAFWIGCKNCIFENMNVVEIGKQQNYAARAQFWSLEC